MKITKLALAIATLGLSIAQCGPKAGTIGPTGFAQDTYHYRVSYRDLAQKLFISADWQLDNYYFDSALNTWKPKTGPDYQAVREFDADEDGTISASEKRSEFIYDLRFTHAKDDGIIWVKAHPVAQSESRRDLEVELNDYADGMAGTGLYAQGNLFSLERVKARTYTTFVTSKKPIKIGSLSGIVGEVELADIERLRLDPQHRSGKLKVVLARFIFQKQATTAFGGTTGASSTPGAKPKTIWREGIEYVEKTRATHCRLLQHHGEVRRSREGLRRHVGATRPQRGQLGTDGHRCRRSTSCRLLIRAGLGKCETERGWRALASVPSSLARV